MYTPHFWCLNFHLKTPPTPPFIGSNGPNGPNCPKGQRRFSRLPDPAPSLLSNGFPEFLALVDWNHGVVTSVSSMAGSSGGFLSNDRDFFNTSLFYVYINGVLMGFNGDST